MNEEKVIDIIPRQKIKHQDDLKKAIESIQDVIDEIRQLNKDEVVYNTIEVLVPKELYYMVTNLIDYQFKNRGDITITFTIDALKDYIEKQLDNPPERTIVVQL